MESDRTTPPEVNGPGQPERLGKASRLEVSKSPTGISGLDEVTGGGLPTGKVTLVCGNAGSGKTLMGVEFLIRGATLYNEPGVFISFEETAEELINNVQSLGFNLGGLCAEKKIIIDSIQIDQPPLDPSGEFNLEGLFIRLDHAVQLIGAKRVVFDTLEALFEGLPGERILRAEFRRLFRWVKERGLTALVTNSSRESGVTRLGLAEYIADCVIFLDQRVESQIGTRRLRVVKYRGSHHGTNEYPFIIGKEGISVLPITAVELDYTAPRERFFTGMPELDAMFSGQGLYRGSSTLVSGGPGTGKSSMAVAFVDASCRRNERCLLFSYEESVSQIIRNMSGIGFDLQHWIDQGLLEIHSVRASLYGLEIHLTNVRNVIERFRPSFVAMDPVTTFSITPNPWEIKPFLTSLIDFLKTENITSLFTCLIPGGGNQESSQLAISSLIDTWVLLRNCELDGELIRLFTVFKARGLAHSNLTRRFLITDHGVKLGEVFRKAPSQFS